MGTTTCVDATTVAVRGEIDQATAPALAVALAAPGIDRMDLSGVTFIDVAGITVVLEAAGRGLTMVDPSRCVRRVLDLVRRRAELV